MFAVSDPAAALLQLDRIDCEESLLCFVRRMWPVVEPATELVEGRTLEAICQHLEAVTDGRIRRLLINVPPGSMKSLLTSVFWPAWEWTTRPWRRYVCFSYSASLTERDNRKFLSLIMSQEYQTFWPIHLDKAGERMVSNHDTGTKLATSVGGVGTGERGDVVILDDPHSVSQAESEAIRHSTIEWFANAMSNRLNDARTSSIVIIMQRVHEDDVSGFVLSKELGYTHLMIPAEFDENRAMPNGLGWMDWRTIEGESFWPDRYPVQELARFRATMSPYAYSGQYQQNPEPKGGGIIKRDWWVPWVKPAYPFSSYIIASLDTAYTEKQENDPSALTIWGVWHNDEGAPKVILMHAWQGRHEIHDLVKMVVEQCRKFRVTRLLVEAKASGISVSQEIRRLFQFEDWTIQMVNPGQQDKVSRAHSVSHLFYEGLIYAPYVTDPVTKQDWPRRWAEMVIDQCAKFPRAAHDDLVDSTTQALNHLRMAGVLVRQIEYKAEIDEQSRFRREPEALYPVG